MWPNIWSLLENVSCPFEKNVYCVVVGWSVLYISIRSRKFIVLLKSYIFLMIFLLTYSIHYWRWSTDHIQLLFYNCFSLCNLFKHLAYCVAWVTQSVKHLTLDFCIGDYLRVVRSSLLSGFEPAYDSLPLPTACMCTLSLSKKKELREKKQVSRE